MLVPFSHVMQLAAFFKCIFYMYELSCSNSSSEMNGVSVLCNVYLLGISRVEECLSD